MTKNRISAAAALAGGALWIIYATLVVRLPEGCVGDECLLRSHRDPGDLELLFLGGGVLLLVAYAGLRAGPASRISVVAGVLLVLVGATSEDLWVPFVLAGMVALVIGFVLAGTAVRPRWIGVLLIAGSLGLLAANDQDARVLMLIPFGLAWICVGVAHWTSSALRIRSTMALRSRSAS
jgi:hypothetical protein